MVNIRSVVTLNRRKEQSLSWNCEFILVEQKYFQEQLVFSCMRVRVRGSIRPKQGDAFMGLLLSIIVPVELVQSVFVLFVERLFSPSDVSF